ncbi:winged helix-turn-helix transcriptional regulator [Yinghuangia aomiensis]
MENVTGRWGGLVLVALADGATSRFNALRRRVDGIARRCSPKPCMPLERGSLVVREVKQAIPPNVEYRLTEFGSGVVEAPPGADRGSSRATWPACWPTGAATRRRGERRSGRAAHQAVPRSASSVMRTASTPCEQLPRGPEVCELSGPSVLALRQLCGQAPAVVSLARGPRG